MQHRHLLYRQESSCTKVQCVALYAEINQQKQPYKDKVPEKVEITNAHRLHETRLASLFLAREYYAFRTQWRLHARVRWLTDLSARINSAT